MTEKEFDQLRNSYSKRNGNTYEKEEPSGYFSYFKLRCMICLIILLTIIVLDRQIGIRDNEKVTQCMQLLGKEELTIEECLKVIEP